MTSELRILDPSDRDAWYGMVETAFGGPPEAPERRALWRDLTEPDRSLAVWDGGRVVGAASTFSFRMAVPGGAVVPAGGLTMVGVAATHRRVLPVERGPVAAGRRPRGGVLCAHARRG